MIPAQIRKLTFIIVLLFIFGSCQEEALVEDQEDLIDQDLISATELVDEYINASGARSDAMRSIIILRYEKGKLLYASSKNDFESYEELQEESVTAIVEPGEYVFWYSGQGVSDLDGVEFDKESQQLLTNYPEEVDAELLWVVRIPDQYEDANKSLKYDVIYDFEGNPGPAIRLDPKLQIEN